MQIWHDRFTTVTLKALSKYELDINAYVKKKVTLSQKNDVIFHIFDQIIVSM